MVEASHDPEAIGLRMKNARESLGYSQPQMAEAVGAAKRAIQDNEAGKSMPGSATLSGYARAGVNVNWLLTGEGEMWSRPPARPMRPEHLAGTPFAAQPAAAVEFESAELVEVPRYDVEASLGPGCLPDQEAIVDRWAFRGDWLRTELRVSPDRVFLVAARGDSMAETIKDGDLLMVDRSQRQVEAGGIYLLRLADALYAKRLQRRADGTILVKSDNPAYDTEEVPPDRGAELKVIGRVVWHGEKV